jgi:hypothetical protein
MPLPSTMTPIATNTLASTSTAITFSNIPSNYTDLRLIVNYYAPSSQPGNIGGLKINGATTNYSDTLIYADGSTASSIRDSVSSNRGVIMLWRMFSTGNEWGILTADFPNYSNTTTFKNVLFRVSGNTGGWVSGGIGLYQSTSAVSTIELTRFGTDFIYGIGTTATLYGIKAA